MGHVVDIHPALQARLEQEVPPRLDEGGRPVRALLLYSGGLDSTLAGVLLRLQGVDVVAVNLFTGLCLTDHKRKRGDTHADGTPYRNEAVAGAASLRIPVDVVDVREGYLRVLTDPKHGRGSAMNPCIDCRIHMLSFARRELLDEYGAHFVATGEVVGQRPMTQKKRQMALIERESGLEGLVLRPLSARILPETVPEQRGWVDRTRLLGLSGRGRRPQLALAEELGVMDFPQPAGGCCFLTDGSYGHRLKDAIDHQPDLDFEDILLLKVGRHFRLPGGGKLVVGRDHGDNELLRAFWHLGTTLEAQGVKGPLALLQAPLHSDDGRLARRIVARYADTTGPVPVQARRGDEVLDAEPAAPLAAGDEAPWKIL